jgi:hypothetical protein
MLVLVLTLLMTLMVSMMTIARVLQQMYHFSKLLLLMLTLELVVSR